MRELTRAELALVRWQFNNQSGFEAALWTAIHRADSSNLELLARGYPEEVEAYTKYMSVSGYWQEVMEIAEKAQLT